LLSNFDDYESSSSGLTYTIVSNSNSALFDSASINSSTNQLVLNAASNASGRATIVVRATDSSGLSVDMPVTIDVDRENQAPEILNFNCAYAGPGTWVISGDVVDADDNVAKFIVEFSGVFVIRSAVDETGHFEFAIILEGDPQGLAYAITYDPHGLASNSPFGVIGMT
jgi:hypothetical protein